MGKLKEVIDQIMGKEELPRLNHEDMIKNKDTTVKRIKVSTKEDCSNEIYQLLALASKPLTTSQIAKEVNLSHKSTLAHLKFLEFDDRIKHFERGCWLYWKIKR